MAGNHDLQLIKCASDIKYWFKILQDLSVLWITKWREHLGPMSQLSKQGAWKPLEHPLGSVEGDPLLAYLGFLGGDQGW